MQALLEDVQLFPQTLINVRLQEGVDWTQHGRLTSERQIVEGELAGRGRVLIRASGTEPLLRIMVEADDAILARRSAERLAASLN
jgi:phosphoglucosamine mutase